MDFTLVLLTIAFKTELSLEWNLSPSTIDVVEGENFTLTCSSQNLTRNSMRWSISRSNESEFVADSVLKNNVTCYSVGEFSVKNYSVHCESNTVHKIVVYNVGRSNNGESWQCGTNTEKSNTVVVNVKVPVSSVQIQPNIILSAKENDTVSFKCTTSFARPGPNIKWFLTGNGQEKVLSVQGNILYTKNTYDLYSARSSFLYTAYRSHNGLYLQCSASNQPNKTVLSEKVRLDIKYAAIITSFGVKGHEGKDTIIATRNDTVQFACLIDAVATEAKLLFKSERALTEQSNATSIQYTIDKVTCVDSGVYSCISRNKYNILQPSTKHVAVYVKCPPQVTDSIPHKNTVIANLGDTVTFRLSVNAFPEPDESDFMWMKEMEFGVIIVNSTPHTVISTKGLNTTLTVKTITADDFGKYLVSVDNDEGELVQFYTLEPAASDDDIVGLAAGSTAGGMVLILIVAAIVLVMKRNSICSNMNCFENSTPRKRRESTRGQTAKEKTAPDLVPESGNMYETIRDELTDKDREYQEISLSETESKVLYKKQLIHFLEKRLHTPENVSHQGPLRIFERKMKS